MEQFSSGIIKALNEYEVALQKHEEKMLRFDNGELSNKPKPPKLKSPEFLTFIRTPFLVSFEIGEPQNKPYKIMAINAHLLFGDTMSDRRKEFDALLNWINGRVFEKDRTYYQDFILLGDLNLDFDNPVKDRVRIETWIKEFDQKQSAGAFVNFPFIDQHPAASSVFRTNAREDETFDQIAIFGRDKRLPNHTANATMGGKRVGPDYGVFNFVELFREALGAKPISRMNKDERTKFFARFEHEVSDHLPLWLRLPMPS